MMDESFGGEISSESNDVSEQFLPLAQRLATDGAQWRAQQALLVDKVEHHLRSRLHTGSAESAPQIQMNQRSEPEPGMEEEQLLDHETIDNRLHRTGQALEVQDAPIKRPKSSSRRPLRFLALTGVAAAAVLIIAVLGTMTLLNQTPSPQGVPLPRLYIWSHHAAYDSRTPQEAFAANVQLTPCIYTTSSGMGRSAPPETATVTWLDAGRDYGLAFINITCPPHQPRPYAIWLFSLGRDSEGQWDPQAGYFGGSLGPGSGESSPTTSSSTSVSDVPVPAWLRLPSDNYVGIRVPGPMGLHPPASVAAWCSSSRTFVFGHVADPATRPAAATSVQVNGQVGWMTEEHGIVIVTLPLADGSTAFFAGTGTAQQVEDLAATAFTHMDEVLPPLPH